MGKNDNIFEQKSFDNLSGSQKIYLYENFFLQRT